MRNELDASEDREMQGRNPLKVTVFDLKDESEDKGVAASAMKSEFSGKQG